MNELRSKCCGAEIIKMTTKSHKRKFEYQYYECKKCHRLSSPPRPTQVEETKEE